LKIRATGLAGQSSAQPELASSYFLSSGERIKGEGGRKTQNSSASINATKMPIPQASHPVYPCPSVVKNELSSPLSRHPTLLRLDFSAAACH
jgi:hypothetical protein